MIHSHDQSEASRRSEKGVSAMQGNRIRAVVVVAALATALGIGFILGDAHVAAGSTARANVTVRKLAAKVSALQSRLNGAIGRINTVQSKLTSLTNANNDTQAQLITAQNSINDLHSRLFTICQNGQLVTNVDFVTQSTTTVSCPS